MQAAQENRGQSSDVYLRGLAFFPCCQRHAVKGWGSWGPTARTTRCAELAIFRRLRRSALGRGTREQGLVRKEALVSCLVTLCFLDSVSRELASHSQK